LTKTPVLSPVISVREQYGMFSNSTTAWLSWRDRINAYTSRNAFMALYTRLKSMINFDPPDLKTRYLKNTPLRACHKH
jgi:hypothetical protein